MIMVRIFNIMCGESVAGEEVAGVDAGGDVGQVGGGAVGQDGA